ncbi:DUF2490 domain-containing protein [Marinilongibacter aquaticus]|uniref:DUF2490 domain-containing protein n=1 Tax=Marinilongibacter aquaticus TaxID=2975157 RepID=UPI0021BDE5F3|nr:DUF2490 domain-containing protein [Marinilongibacter aquaticus]UBM60611.1 DUF2490 domain-containing protein [Marinilongibacter aquaticus]
MNQVKRRVGLIGLFVGLSCLFAKAQITPPGLGEMHTASWAALGVKQKLNAKGNLTSTTYVGEGAISTPKDYNPFERASIYVLNEEIAHQFSKNWKYSGALSYRWQNEYKSSSPFEKDNPSGRQEIRLYARYSYLTGQNRTRFSFTYRPELRFFFNPDFSPNENRFQFRSRLGAKVSFALNEAQTQKLIVSSEFLLALNKSNEDWQKLKYNDTRFCLYYSVAVPKSKIVLDIGYMNDLIAKSPTTDVHYLAVDLIFKNPFSKAKPSR